MKLILKERNAKRVNSGQRNGGNDELPRDYAITVDGILRLKMTMDYIVPLARVGKSTRGNLVTACKECNNNKKINLSMFICVPLLFQKCQRQMKDAKVF
ncbi:hypothetical protein BuS5_00074 [Desulfosarcina sp. BuS5]|uniref:HNH endonuclease n=1 Tax=Desulfosarcina sp. BuS5 TaxID=933262 RepID=UPI0026F3ABEA|nr:HNH endonuclease signature motif containing protein [Desulfosarcina sp. BuS5]WDN87106.1 hypothetical protein BuS5_00074 [Desulfosarcina sp. BuS5]